MDISSLTTSAPSVLPVPSTVGPGQAAENRELIQTVRALNATQFAGENREFTFTLDRETHRPVLRLIDTQTKEVLEQFPAEYLLRVRQVFDALVK